MVEVSRAGFGEPAITAAGVSAREYTAAAAFIAAEGAQPATTVIVVGVVLILVVVAGAVCYVKQRGGGGGGPLVASFENPMYDSQPTQAHAAGGGGSGGGASGYMDVQGGGYLEPNTEVLSTGVYHEADALETPSSSGYMDVSGSNINNDQNFGGFDDDSDDEEV